MQESVNRVGALSPITLLIVDDDRAVREACEAIVQSMGIATLSASSAREGLSLIERMPVNIVLTDLRMPGMNGLEFLETLRKVAPDVYVIVMSGFGSIESAVQAMQGGAYNFISKPFGFNDLRALVRRIEGQILESAEARSLRSEMAGLSTDALLIGRSPEIQQIHRVIVRAASSSSPILIQGESGTGKELLARSIHLATKDSQKPFIPVDCYSLSPEFLEHELFGYAEGAFPGAFTAKQGLLANAECGTVFLDEVAKLSLDVQAKLVRALQQKEIRPYGALETVPFRARIIASTSRDLSTAVASGHFRQDLYYRLNALVLRLPSLRQRKDDIPLLIEHCLQKLHTEYGAKKSISPEAVRALVALDWPGNIRELETVLERAFTRAMGNLIGISDLPDDISVKTFAPPSETALRALSLAEIERESVIRALETSGGDKQKTARLLGISRTTLYRKLHEYKLSS
jgi:two-component system response regulator HydG